MTNWPAGGPPSWASNIPVASLSLQKHSDAENHNKERGDRPMSLVAGTDAAVGDLLVLDNSGTDKVARTSSAGQAGPVWIALEALTAGGVAGWVRLQGCCSVNVIGPTVAGDWLRASATPGKAEPCAVGDPGAFAVATSSSSTVVSAVLVNGVGAAGGGGGGSGTNFWDPSGLATPPDVADLSVHDQWAVQTALTQAASGAAYFRNPGDATSWRERAAYGTTSGPFAVPAPPYTATVCFRPNLPQSNYWGAALSLRDSVSDKRLVYRVYYSADTIRMDQANLPDALNTGGAGSFAGSLTYRLDFPIWLRVRDDGTTRYYEWSVDGVAWVPYQSGASGFYTAPDQAGISMISNGSTAVEAAMTVLHLSVVNTA